MNFPWAVTNHAITTKANDASSWAPSKYGNFDDNSDQKLLDTTTAFVISDPSNTLTEVSIVGSVEEVSELAASNGWGSRA